MFQWFQRLLPHKGDFFQLFEAHAATLVGAAEALQELANDGSPVNLQGWRVDFYSGQGPFGALDSPWPRRS